MDYRSLGSSGLKVSPYLPRHDDVRWADRQDGGVAASSRTRPGRRRQLHRHRRLLCRRRVGETFVGRADRRDRDWWVIATKVGIPHRPGSERGRDLSRRQILRVGRREPRAGSGTDRIDLYYLHRDDETTPLEETLRAVGDLIRAGKILYLGLSNFRAGASPRPPASAAELGDRPADRRPAVLQRDESPARGGAPPRLCTHLRPWRRPVQSPCPRRPHRQVPLRAKRRPPNREPAVGDARTLETEWREESLKLVRADPHPGRGARHDDGPVRAQLAAEQRRSSAPCSPVRGPWTSWGVPWRPGSQTSTPTTRR